MPYKKFWKSTSLMVLGLGLACVAPPELAAAPHPSRETYTPKEQAILKQLSQGSTAPDVHSLSLVHPKSFPEVTLVGSFADDKGDELYRTFVGTTMLAAGHESKAILATRDWRHLALEQRKTLAKAYVREVLFAFDGEGSLVTKAVAKAPRISTSVQVSSTAGGKIMVRYWQKAAPGKQPADHYALVQTTFSPRGEVTVERLKHLEVPLHQP